MALLSARSLSASGSDEKRQRPRRYGAESLRRRAPLPPLRGTAPRVARRMRGRAVRRVLRIRHVSAADVASLSRMNVGTERFGATPHPSPLRGDTFSRKGRREGEASGRADRARPLPFGRTQPEGPVEGSRRRRDGSRSPLTPAPLPLGEWFLAVLSTRSLSASCKTRSAAIGRADKALRHISDVMASKAKPSRLRDCGCR